MLIEIMTFRLGEGVDEATFLAADRRVQLEFAYQQPGMVRRTTARGDDGTWAVVDFWQSAAHADDCLQRWRSDQVAATFDALVTDVSVSRFESLD